MHMLLSTSPLSFDRSFRRTSRHRLATTGQAVLLEGFRLVGERFLDASAEGALLACDAEVRRGDKLVVSFPVPGSALVFDAEAEVARVIAGHREGDPGYCAGLRFTYFDRRDRLALGLDLRALPLVPRRVRWGYRPRSPVAIRKIISVS